MSADVDNAIPNLSIYSKSENDINAGTIHERDEEFIKKRKIWIKKEKYEEENKFCKVIYFTEQRKRRVITIIRKMKS